MNNTTNKDILNINLENTEFFNYKGGQSTIYNFLKENGISTVLELFNTNHDMLYATCKDTFGENLFIKDELIGNIKLIKYQYLGIDEISDILNKKIDVFLIRSSNNIHSYNYPGDVFKTVGHYKKDTEAYQQVINAYHILKCCGFDQSNAKGILDDISNKKLHTITIGEYLSNIDFNDMKNIFSKVPNEYKVLCKKTTILLNCYKKSLETKHDTTRKKI